MAFNEVWSPRVVAVVVAIAALTSAAGCGDDIPRTADAPVQPRGAITAPDSEKAQLMPIEPVRKYNVPSAVIEYANSRLGRTQTYYFTEYGAREATYTRGVTPEDDVPFDVSIYSDGWRYDYNSHERTGIAKLQPNAQGPLLGSIPDLRTVGVTPTDKRTIAGRSTTGVTYNDGVDVRLWMWKGIPLRIERPLSSGDTLLIEARSVSVDSAIGVAPFVVPKEIAIKRSK